MELKIAKEVKKGAWVIGIGKERLGCYLLNDF